MLKRYWPIVIILLVVAYNVADQQRCKYQWNRSGLERHWSPISGCMLRMPGTIYWVPASSYKVSD